MNRLDAEEAAILKAFEEGQVTSAANAEEIRDRHQRYAQAMADSSSNPSVHIQLPADDLRRLQQQADREGVPRDTLIASILHRHIENPER